MSRVDTDGTIVQGGDMTLNVSTPLIGGCLVTANSSTGKDVEVTRVGIGLEVDEIRDKLSIESFPSTLIMQVIG